MRLQHMRTGHGVPGWGFRQSCMTLLLSVVKANVSGNGKFLACGRRVSEFQIDCQKISQSDLPDDYTVKHCQGSQGQWCLHSKEMNDPASADH